MIVTSGSGLGFYWGTGSEADTATFCKYMPFSDLFARCKVPTITNVDPSYGPALTPESRAAAQRETARLLGADCRNNPEECRDYRAAVGCPTISALIGPAAASNFGCGSGVAVGDDPGERPWGLYLLLAGVGLLAVMRN